MKYLITGGSGYIGGRLTDLLIQHEENEVVNLDIRAPAVPRSRTRFVRMDIRDRGIAALIAQEQPDALVHLAFVLNPIRDEHLMYDIDVNGTQNVLEAAAAAGVPHLLVASSTTAYGAWPDNPVPIPEEHPVRGLPAYEYARDKTEIDRLCQLWAAQHPDRTMTIVRPTIVFGPSVDNYILRFWQNSPFFPLLDGHDPDWQFVHEDDVVYAMSRLLTESRGGIFNLTADGTMKLSECARIAGVKTRKMPLGLYRRIAKTAWRLRLPNVEAPPGQIDFLVHPWLASNEKIKAELDWIPRYTSRETFELTMRAKGIGTGQSSSGPAVPSPPPPAPVA
jgi:UDP-glucose 4-epimerase